jgi:hypothetical protein
MCDCGCEDEVLDLAGIEKKMKEMELKSAQFGLEYSRDQRKRDRVQSLLNVIETLSKGYVSDMNLKNEATNLATLSLIKELKSL